MASNYDVPRKSQNLLVHPSFQIKLLSYFAGLFIVTCACLYSTTFLFYWRLKEKATKVGIPEGHVFFDFISYIKQDLDNLFLGLVALNFILLLSVGLILTHRIAGPLHKLKKHLKGEASSGEPFKLRKNDFFQDLEPIVNELKDRNK